MNINAKRGDKITVSTESLNNGYPDMKIRARKHLKVGEIYTIDTINVDNWATAIKLVEIPNVTFTSVNFIDIPNEKK